MLDVLGVLFEADVPLEVLDLASGPAGISVRVLDRFPNARSVAIDVDPVLLAIGRGTHGDLDGRLTWVEHDLRDPAWTDTVRAAAAGRQHVDAVLSSTALHWIPSGDLVDVYRACATLLAPGGVLVNCDNMDYPSGWNTIRRISDAARVTHAAPPARRRDRGPTSKAGSSGGRTSPPRPSSLSSTTSVFAASAGATWPQYRPGLAVHAAFLEEAGFREVDTVWQRYQNRVLVAIR